MSIILANSSTTLAINDRGFLYGDGFFSTMRVRQGCVGLWSLHQARLEHTCHQLGLQIEVTEVVAAIERAATALVSGTLKVLISRGAGLRGYAPPNQPATAYIQSFAQVSTEDDQHVDWPKLSAPITAGVATHVMGWPMPQLVGLKTLNRLEQVLLKQQLACTSWHEALVCDRAGMIIEGVQSNVWMLIDGQWHTPDLQHAGIHGVMRQCLIDRLQAKQIPIQIAPISLQQIDQIEAMLFCNALSLQPVGTLVDDQGQTRVLCVDAAAQLVETLL